MGGIQKSLVNLVKEVYKDYDITLLLFSKSGSLLGDIPDDVKIVTPLKIYSILGLEKSVLKKHPFLFALKAFLLMYAKIFSRRSAMKLLGIFQKKISGYDAVISYSHLPHHKYFGNGCGDFVLDKTRCKNKVCFVHCDYMNFGGKTELNNKEYMEFDKIACCSDSVRERFLLGSKLLKSKVFAVRNFYDLDLASYRASETGLFDEGFINIIIVARLSEEKGILRAIDALLQSKRTDICYYIIGDGPQKEILQDKIKKHSMEKQVVLLGEQKNPYRYMSSADYLLVPSLHEAAPMVFDEANILGVPIISTNTTSAKEMISSEQGIICENSTTGIVGALLNIEKSFESNDRKFNNEKQRKQLEDVLRAKLICEEAGYN